MLQAPEGYPQFAILPTPKIPSISEERGDFSMSIQSLRRSDADDFGPNVPNFGTCSDCGRKFTGSHQSVTYNGGRICRDAQGCVTRSSTTQAHQERPAVCASCNREFTALSQFTYVLGEKVCRDNEDCVIKVLDVAEGRAIR
jgi:hypothetical protein